MLRVAFLYALACLSLLLSGCSDPGSAGREAAGQTKIGGESGRELAARQVLRRGNGAEPQSLDPHKSEGVPESNLQRDLFEGLTNDDPELGIVPGAARAWEISADGTVYVFHMRENGRWSNGDPVTAQDFAYGLRRSVDPATLSNYSIMLRPILNAEKVIAGELPPEALGVRAIDDLTLEIRLEAPTPYFLGVLNHSSAYPVHRPTVERYGGRWARPGRLVSNGAYRLKDWVMQSHIVMERNPYYWDNDNTTIDEVWFYPIENQSTELQRYRADALDMTYDLPFRQLGWIRENLPDELVISEYLGVYYYGLNVTQPPFKDNVELRRALNLAVDREILTRQVTTAGEIPAYGYVPRAANYEQVVPEWAAWTQEERVAEARRLYEAAGYSRDNPLKVQILYNTHENHRTIAVAIASMWKEALGIEVELVNEEWKVYLETRRTKQTTQVFRAGWIADYNDAYNFLEILHSQSGLNDPGWNNPQYDALLEEAARENDLERRAELMHQAEQLVMEDVPVIPVYFYVTKRLVKPWVGNYRPHVQDFIQTKDLEILKH
ncbi:peptide ABC transporter substrate-binding protein [Thioalkalivibrio sp. XN279]|uniref:peptide ABC transporter substrate-binding protein n=1 Tax=Thioalkalivibrio sp. XN279 TaxID=2714953 RepID=UPI00140A3A5B|nr:peptide ABC transporter substrate-binding protein [Thioalkalivibrio sp. XN279]NHA14896.1 peptide ABC transporter substrate-binding protein [Thioalkalivibrio sp. XN279]